MSRMERTNSEGGTSGSSSATPAPKAVQDLSCITTTSQQELKERTGGEAKLALQNLEQLHQEILRKEQQLEKNVEAIRLEILACFQHCQQKLKKREETLLAKLHQEHRRLKRALLAPKRMAINTTHTSLNGGMRGFSKTESEGGIKSNISASAITECAASHNAETEFIKMMPTIQKALNFADTPFNLSRADRGMLQQFDSFVDGLGMVYLGDADPSRTNVIARPALVLAENTAKVKGITQKGNECTCGGAEVCASLKNPEGVQTPCDVEDCLNGIYRITYTPQMVGTHYLHVTISGDAISNSPLEVEVKPVRLLPNKAFVGGKCTAAMEMPREYHYPLPGKDDNDLGRTQKLSLQSLKIAILDPEGKDVEASVTGTIKRRGAICTYTLKYLPKVTGIYEVKVSRLGNDDILLAHAVMPVYDKEQIGRRGQGKGFFDNPTDVILTSEGNLLVADSVENERVQCLTSDGQYKYEFSFPGQEPILLAANASHVAALMLNVKRVRVLTTEGSMVHEFGHAGFMKPFGIAINSEDHVYVSDGGAHCIFIFNLEGGLRRQFGKQGSGPGEFDFPNYIFIDPCDNVYVSEAKNYRIQVFKAGGEYVKEVRSANKLPQPGAIVATASGYLLVHNESDSRVQILNLDNGRFVGDVLVDLMAPYTRRIAVTKTGFLMALDMSSHCLWRYRIPFE